MMWITSILEIDVTLDKLLELFYSSSLLNVACNVWDNAAALFFFHALVHAVCCKVSKENCFFKVTGKPMEGFQGII